MQSAASHWTLESACIERVRLLCVCRRIYVIIHTGTMPPSCNFVTTIANTVLPNSG
jgi:hypothetical protein